MTLNWFRHYPTNGLLAAMFGTNVSMITRVIKSNLPVLYHHLQNCIQWPTAQEWSAMRQRWEMFPQAVGRIDGILHEINHLTVNIFF